MLPGLSAPPVEGPAAGRRSCKRLDLQDPGRKSGRKKKIALRGMLHPQSDQAGFGPARLRLISPSRAGRSPGGIRYRGQANRQATV